VLFEGLQFTVKVGTVFDSAHIPLHKMLQAMFPDVRQQEGHRRAAAPSCFGS
jgi:hypothetical protein